MELTDGVPAQICSQTQPCLAIKLRQGVACSRRYGDPAGKQNTSCRQQLTKVTKPGTWIARNSTPSSMCHCFLLSTHILVTVKASSAAYQYFWGNPNWMKKLSETPATPEGCIFLYHFVKD